MCFDQLKKKQTRTDGAGGEVAMKMEVMMKMEVILPTFFEFCLQVGV